MTNPGSQSHDEPVPHPIWQLINDYGEAAELYGYHTDNTPESRFAYGRLQKAKAELFKVVQELIDQVKEDS